MTSMADITQAVAADYALTPSELMGAGRDGKLAMPRQIVAWLALRHDIDVAVIMRVMNRTKTVVWVMAGHVEKLRIVDTALYARTYRLDRMLDTRAVQRPSERSPEDVVRDYRRRGATIPSIARFTGQRPADVARILGSDWRGD